MNDEPDMSAMVADLGDSLGFGDGGGENDLDTAVDTAVDKAAGSKDSTTPEKVPAVSTEAAPTASTPAKAAPSPDAPAKPADAPLPVDAAPRTWRAEAAAEWAALTPKVKAEILKREDDMFRGIEGYKEDASWGKGIKNLLSPYLPMMQQMNLDPMQQVGNLMNAHYALATGSPQAKADLIARLVKDYKVDASLVNIPDPASAPYVLPEVEALRKDLAALQSAEQGRQKETETRIQSELSTDIDKFASDPKNIHFGTVGYDMAKLIETGVAKGLQDAYDRAIWLNPVTRAKEIERANTEAAKAATAAMEAKAEEARKASAANVKARAKSGSAAAPLGTMEDTMNATLVKIRQRSS